MSFVKTSFYSAISTAVSLVVRLITNKIVAVYLGTNGMFLLGQLKDFMNVSGAVSHMGTTSGTIKYVAEYKDSANELKKLLGTGFKIHIGFSLLICLIIIVFNEQLSVYLFSDSKYDQFLIVFGLAIVSMSIQTLLLSILNGLKKIKLYVTITIISTIISAIILVFLVLNYELIGAFYAYAINQFIILLIAWLIIAIYKPFRLKFLMTSFYKSIFKKSSKFSLMALAGPICLISATLFVRYFLANEFDNNHAGSWEGMWRISAIYLLFLTTTFQFYLLPTFSVLDGKELKKEIFKIWSYVLPTIIVIAIVVYLLKDLVITLLFSEEFLLIGTIIGFHLLGDIVKINTWVLGNVLISKTKTKAFILFQIEWALAFGLFTYLFVNSYGFIGVAIAYLCANVLHFLLMNLYFRKLLWIRT
jgi:PST family polysaccharide transporter